MFEVTRLLKSINKGSPGFKNPEIIGMLGFAPHILKPIFYYTKIDPNNSPELLNLLSKHNFLKNGPTNANEIA